MEAVVFTADRFGKAARSFRFQGGVDNAHALGGIEQVGVIGATNDQVRLQGNNHFQVRVCEAPYPGEGFCFGWVIAVIGNPGNFIF